jgi:WD40 repeat protein
MYPNALSIVRHGVGDSTARIRDTATAKEIAVLRGHEAQVNSAAFIPDGSRIVTVSGAIPSAAASSPIWRDRGATSRAYRTSKPISPESGSNS